ncbi:hypothetical protein [Paenibacillus sp. HW567]|uniref:hypothetical protein n=1 Tax=Paenibacillus sp. HW567 TaxID=1034769 RepID=UPI00037F4D0D|nr:hypothetical protein [Paenibacillus sp. HW567]
MASTKLIFNVDEVERLRTKIGQVSQDTNLLYLQLNGQANNWGGIPLGQDLVQAQVLINELTVEAEKLEDIIRQAVKGVQSLQEENKRQASQLTQQFSLFAGMFGNFGGNGSQGRFSIPPFAQKAATKLISSIAALTGRDGLDSDPVVKNLRDLLQKFGPGTIEGISAQSKLNDIYEARNLIEKTQTAYDVYQAFGNKTQMNAMHKLAEEARKKLESLGVDKVQYEAGKDLSAYFKQPAVKACDYDPSITTSSVPLVRDESYLLLLRMAMEPGKQGAWAKGQLDGKRVEIKLAEAAKIVAAQMEAEKRLNGPPMNLPDGTPITANNKVNETTMAYFQDKVYDPNAQLTPMYTMYLGWLEDTYGMTEWRKRVVQADAVTSAFVGALIEETVMGVVDTVKLAFNFVVDPQKTTQEMVDKANYVIEHPEVLVEAVRTVYQNFDEGTPEEKAAMLGSVASILVPGLSITKSEKIGKVVDGVQELTTKAMDGVKDLNKVIQNSEHFTGFSNPFLSTPEGGTFKIGKIIPEQNPLPKTSVQEHYLNEMDGLGDVKAGKIEGTGEIPKRNYEPSPKHDPQSGWGSPNPIPDAQTGQQLLDSAYLSSKNKQLYNIYEGKLVKFQPDGESGWHPYEVVNPAKEVPADVLRQMVNDGKISKADYNKMIKNNK